MGPLWVLYLLSCHLPISLRAGAKLTLPEGFKLSWGRAPMTPPPTRSLARPGSGSAAGLQPRPAITERTSVWQVPVHLAFDYLLQDVDSDLQGASRRWFSRSQHCAIVQPELSQGRAKPGWGTSPALAQLVLPLRALRVLRLPPLPLGSLLGPLSPYSPCPCCLQLSLSLYP